MPAVNILMETTHDTDTEALLNKYCDTVPETPHKTELIITIRIPAHFLFFIYPP